LSAEKNQIKDGKTQSDCRGDMMTAKCTERVCSIVKECKGVCSILEELDDSQRKKVLELEIAEESKLLQFGAGIENQGVKEVLTRDVVLLITNDETFEYRDPTILLKANDEIVGEEISDPAKLEEIRGKPGYFFTGKGSRPFVIYTHKLRAKRGVPVKFTTLPFSLPHEGLKGLESTDGIGDLICGWPSRSVDQYLKQTFSLPMDDVRLGTLLVGFNITASPKKSK
jgi:hypothetical protein